MMELTRRAALMGAALTAGVPMIAAPVWAGMPTALTTHPGFAAWTPQTHVGGLPLQEAVETEAGARRLGDWLNHRPAVVALWASWCAPCLVEKPYQAALGRRLASAGCAARVLALQVYDDESVTFAFARSLLDRIGARGLPSARATLGAEEGLRRIIGTGAGRRRSDTTLPTVLLIGADGLEIGRAVGAMTGVDGETDYWRDEATFDFLSRLL